MNSQQFDTPSRSTFQINWVVAEYAIVNNSMKPPSCVWCGLRPHWFFNRESNESRESLSPGLRSVRNTTPFTFLRLTVAFGPLSLARQRSFARFVRFLSYFHAAITAGFWIKEAAVFAVQKVPGAAGLSSSKHA